MKFIQLLALSILLYTCQEKKQSNSSSSPQKPNVVFILVDDLGLHDLSYTGSNYYETPNIDKLASTSIEFTQGYAASRVCSPSRASIFTGQFTARHGITDWIGAKTGTNWRTHNRHDKLLPSEYIHNLPDKNITLAEAMKSAGYKTFFAGKWHLGTTGSHPEDHGFDINVGGWDKGGPMGGYFSPWKNPKLENKQNGENLSIRLATETANFITNHKDAPFFAFLSFYAVHGPIQTTQSKWKKYRQKAQDQGIKEIGYIMERVLPIRQTQDNPVYAGLVEHMDDAVGIVTKALQEAGVDKNTIIVFTSDNGGVASGDSFSTSNLPLRGGKGYQWEGGIREPYFIKVPWVAAKNKQRSYPVTGADFYPTILDLANIDLLPEQHKDGISLKPIIENTQSTLPERPLYWHYPHYGNQGGEPSSIIREQNWKLIHYWEDGRNELYDLNSDPSEQNNISEKSPDKVKEMVSKLNQWLQEVNAKFPSKDPEYNEAKAKERHHNLVNKRLPGLEKQRKAFLSEDFKPNATWWGSMTTKD
ncbi:sulfatase [Tamlana sp. 2201CG12-4]|uniref:sulfatase n=1 Tax=Tamlana sp. 2201CG12-4 TaxID=3112582 RepID=UPI002DBD9095|nr:sulfatase [Tamlana sp. 2201CG12-4]MEC3905698.1 sulfatase [Tamlana sp. 2201CG12-4]